MGLFKKIWDMFSDWSLEDFFGSTSLDDSFDFRSSDWDSWHDSQNSFIWDDDSFWESSFSGTDSSFSDTLTDPAFSSLEGNIYHSLWDD